ncbi:hypothetical protein [Pseudanabaena sp. FACHB-2040]|uniref:hypothetical protein n=1 Tax=Pseudanabaena sp. FACHB-2040 TaxID=2692859 RepID=UPI001F559563|nr:hypothetical protein [Pseudanabaena sp. FACHB-2040]
MQVSPLLLQCQASAMLLPPSGLVLGGSELLLAEAELPPEGPELLEVAELPPRPLEDLHQGVAAEVFRPEDLHPLLLPVQQDLGQSLKGDDPEAPQEGAAPPLLLHLPAERLSGSLLLAPLDDLQELPRPEPPKPESLKVP